MADNNKAIKSLWGYPLMDSKARSNINDVKNNLENNFQKKTDDALTTTNKTISGAINEVNTQYKDIANKMIFVSHYVKDYSIDNTIGLQKMFDDNTLIPNLKIIFDVPSLKLSNPIKVDRGNLTIDFNNVDIQFENYNDIINYGEGIKSIFTFRGRKTDASKNIVNYKFGIKSTDSSSTFDAITLDNVDDLSIKDYLLIAIGTNTNNGAQDSELSPHQYRLVQISNIEGNVVTIDFANEWDELGTDITLKEMHSAYIVQPLRNIKIENFSYTDNSNITEKDLNKIVSGLSFLYCDNVNLKEIHGENITHQVAHFEYCKNLNVDGCSVKTPRLIDEGCGYGVQFVHSHNIKGHNFTGIKERHLIDLTDCNNADITSILSSSDKFGVSLHGQYEFDVRVSDCKGFFQLGNSGDKFGNASRNIKINNCNLVLYMNYCDKLNISKSYVVCSSGLGIDTIIRDSDILFYNNGNYANLENPYIRKTSNLSITIDNSNIVFNTKSDNVVFFKDYNDIVIKNSTLKSYVVNPSTANERLIVVQTKNKLLLDNVKIDAFFRIMPNGLNSSYIFRNNKFDIYSGEKAIRIYTVIDSNIYIEFENNTYNILEDNSIPIQIDSYNCSNSNIALKFFNNLITDTHSSSITIDLISGNKYTKYLFDKNIIPSTCTLNLCSGNIGDNINY